MNLRRRCLPLLVALMAWGCTTRARPGSNGALHGSGGLARLRASDAVPDDGERLPWQGGTLIVEVKDLHGRPLPGVRVMVRGWDMGGFTTGFGDDTDERGRLEHVVRTGEIEVLLGYRRRVIDVREGRETRVEFRYQAEGKILVQPLPRRGWRTLGPTAADPSVGTRHDRAQAGLSCGRRLRTRHKRSSTRSPVF